MSRYLLNINRIREFVIVLYLSSLTLFRVDLSGGRLGIELTPFLLTSIFLLFYFCIDVISTKTMMHRKYSGFLLVFILFSSYAIIRVIGFKDELQMRRAVLYLIVALSTICFYILFIKQVSSWKRIIEKVFKNSIIIYGIFSSLQFYFFINGYHIRTAESPSSYISLLPQTIGVFLPRFTGGFIDPNVCGYYFISLSILVTLFKIDNATKYRNICYAIVFFTLSRSAIATVLIIQFLVQIKFFIRILEGKVKPYLKKRMVLLCFFILLGLIFGIYFVLDNDFLRTGILLRIEDKGSTGTHNLLLERGMNIFSSNIETIIWGQGFFSSPRLVGDLYGGNKYANFHSEYITLLVELGIIGLFFELLVILRPLVSSLGKRITDTNFYLILGIFGILLENVFYQQYLFFYYWAYISMLWAYSTYSRLKRLEYE